MKSHPARKRTRHSCTERHSIGDRVEEVTTVSVLVATVVGTVLALIEL